MAEEAPSHPRRLRFPTNIAGNDLALTATPIGPLWTGKWDSYPVGKFGTPAQGGVAIYDFNNQSDWWNGEHGGVHPQPFPDNVLTNGGIAVVLR